MLHLQHLPVTMTHMTVRILTRLLGKGQEERVKCTSSETVMTLYNVEVYQREKKAFNIK